MLPFVVEAWCRPQVLKTSLVEAEAPESVEISDLDMLVMDADDPCVFERFERPADGFQRQPQEITYLLTGKTQPEIGCGKSALL